MAPHERLAYLTMFCSLLPVRAGKATFAEALKAAPLVGEASRLAQVLIPNDLALASS